MIRFRKFAASMLLGAILGSCGGGGSSSSTQPQPTPTPDPVVTATPSPEPTPTATATEVLLKQAALQATAAGDWVGASIAVDDGLNASPLTNRQFHAHDSGMFRFVGHMIPAGTSTFLAQMVTNGAVNYNSYQGGNQYFIEFDTTARQFEIAYNGNGAASGHRVIVDGAYVSRDVTQSTFTRAISRVTLPANIPYGWHHVRIEAYMTRFHGIYVAGDETVRLPAERRPVRAVIVGDSYTSGTSGVAGVNHFDCWAPQVARELGWGDFYRSGIGGTGYSNPGNGYFRYYDRFDTDVVAFAPDVLVISGGVNDSSTTIEADARQLFDAIEAKLPDTIVFVVAPFDPRRQIPHMRDLVKSAMGERKNFHFLDSHAEDWLGDRATAIGADNIHPTQAGHDRIAQGFVADVRPILTGF